MSDLTAIGPHSILVACEESATVRDALRAKGFDAWSCDLVPTAGDPRWHIIGDAVQVAYGWPWEAMIAHPPCTNTTVAAAWTIAEKRRDCRQQMSLGLINALWRAPIRVKALERPVSISGSVIGRSADQIIQPYDFGHDASKKTCLWLEGLSPLKSTNRVPGRLVRSGGRLVERWANQTDSGQNRLAPSEDRAGLRSETYTGIAAAMADQWAEHLR